MSFDFIVVGSGYGGMLPAWRLTRAGARVLLIERGRKWARSEFEQSWDLLYLGKLYDFASSTTLTEAYRTSRIMGGGSTMNSMMHQRTPSEAFAFEEPDTRARAWPVNVDREVLNPFYSELENLIGVRQLEWSEVSRTGGNFARLFADSGLTCERGSFNIGKGCVRCGFCEAGCGFEDAKHSLADDVMSQALATGNLTVLENTTASKIVPISGGYRLDCVDSGMAYNAHSTRSFFAPKLILGAGPLGTVPLLLRSRDALGRLSPALGQRISNNGDVNFVFVLPEHYPDCVGYKSTNNGGAISYAFWKEHHVTMHPGFTPVPTMAGIDIRHEGGIAFGLKDKQFVKKNVIHRLIPVNAMRVLPGEMTFTIDGKGAPVINNPKTKVLKDHGPLMLSLAKRVAEPAGGKVLITGIGEFPLDMGGNHILGGARMHDDPKLGVVGPDGQVHGHPGLYVSDATSISGALGVNPALTVGANALRIAHGIVKGAA